jgi:hypothetical protein
MKVPSWVPMYGPSRGAHADYRGSRRDCYSQPMLIRRELKSSALIVTGRVELSPRWELLRLRDFTRKAPSRYVREPVVQGSSSLRCRRTGASNITVNRSKIFALI